MSAQTPAQGIMQTADWPKAKAFTIECDCHSPDHQVQAWIEVAEDAECNDVNLTFYVNGTTPFWKTGFNRFKAAWNMIWHGYHEEQHTLILTRQVALNLASTINRSVKQLDQAKKSPKNP